jgi:hypothetical protein|uniref:PARP catalytic domain-containing protein n=1 Tax=viral metagenome TaxID=1070528 RepID=A0A6C0INV3_9ZZZZ
MPDYNLNVATDEAEDVLEVNIETELASDYHVDEKSEEMNTFYNELTSCFCDLPDIKPVTPGYSLHQYIYNIMKTRVETIAETEIEMNVAMQPMNIEKLYYLIGIRITSPLVLPLIVSHLRSSDRGISIFSILYSWLCQLFKDENCSNFIGDEISRQSLASSLDSESTTTVYMRELTCVISKNTNLTKHSDIMDANFNLETFTGLDSISEDVIRLYHGTTIRQATNIVRLGIDLSKCSQYTDFGAGFYVSPNPSVALSYAVLSSSNGKYTDRSLDPAIVVFDIKRDKFNDLLWEVQGSSWKEIVQSCRRQALNSLERYNPELANSFLESHVVGGYISSNATKIERGCEANACEHVQFAFKKRQSAKEFGNDCVCVMRFHKP